MWKFLLPRLCLRPDMPCPRIRKRERINILGGLSCENLYSPKDICPWKKTKSQDRGRKWNRWRCAGPHPQSMNLFPQQEGMWHEFTRRKCRHWEALKKVFTVCSQFLQFPLQSLDFHVPHIHQFHQRSLCSLLNHIPCILLARLPCFELHFFCTSIYKQGCLQPIFA